MRGAKNTLGRHSSEQVDDPTMLERFAQNGCDQEIASVMAMDMMLAGIDTSSHTVAWTLYQLAANPAVQENLHNEITSILPDKSYKLDSLKLDKMRYLQAALKESFRIMPVVPNTARILGPPVVESMAGYEIDRDCWFVALNQFMSLSEKYFKDPEEFRPGMVVTKYKQIFFSDLTRIIRDFRALRVGH